VSGPGFVQKMVPDIEIKPNETTDVGTINVEKGRSISGRVLHSDGSPVAGAKVMGGPQLMGSGSELQSGGIFGGGGGLKTATSGDDGSYTLAGVGAKGLVMVADHPTEGRSSMVRVPPSDQSTTLDLTLAPPGALEGCGDPRGQAGRRDLRHGDAAAGGARKLHRADRRRRHLPLRQAGARQLPGDRHRARGNHGRVDALQGGGRSSRGRR
jgi:hypothetical protein